MPAGVRPENTLDAKAVVRAWDHPTRLFHWVLVLLIASAYLTRNFSADPTLYWHRLNGYAVLVLLLFRILWGVAGSSTSRLARLLPSPGAAFRYAAALARARPVPYLGHNPLGSLLIVLMLLALVAQATTGLFTSDDTLAQGPLYDHASEAFTKQAGRYHAKGLWIIAGLAVIHIAANLTYQLALRDKLITAMVTGTKPARPYVDEPDARFAPAWHAAVCLLVSAGLVAAGVILAGGSLLR